MAGRRPIVYSFAADTRGIATGVQQGVAGLGRMKESMQEVDRVADRLDGREIDIKANESGMTALQSRLLALRAQIDRDLKIDPEIDVFKAMSDIRRIDSALKRLDRTVELDVDKSGFLMKVGGAFGTVMTDGLSSSLRSAASTPMVGAAAAAAGVQIGGMIVLALTPTLLAGINAAIGGGVAYGGIKLLEQYDSLDKARRKASIVFGGEMGQIRQWAAEMSAGVGLGREQIVGIAAGVQDLMVPKGFNRGDAADITQLIVERGSAIAEFQGLDASQGVDATTAALLGQTRQLKTMGVELSAQQIKDRQALVQNRGYWIDYGKDGVKSADDIKRSVAGMNDEQLKTVSSLELIQEKSTDAWTSFLNGGSAADDILDTLNATIQNLKTDAIGGFGAILVDVLTDIAAAADIKLGFDDGGLAKWIKQNRESITDTFYDLGEVLLVGAESAFQFLKTVNSGVGVMLDMADAAIFLADKLSYVIQAQLAIATGGASLLPTRDFFTGWRNDLAEQSVGVDALRKSHNKMTDDINAGLDGGIKKAREWQEELKRAREFTDTKFEIRADVKKGDFNKAQAQLSGLTKREVKEIIADTKGSDKKVDKQLRELAKSRLAEIRVEIKNESETERRILTLTKDRTIWIQYKDKATGQTLQRPDNTPVSQSLQPGQTVVQINDGRLADFIDANVGGREAAIRRTTIRRYGYV